MKKNKNFVVVLGGGIDMQGHLPDHQIERLKKAVELFRKNPDSKIVLSGKYSFLYEKEKPPITEAKAMMIYLTQNGVDKDDLILEEESMDTIGNAYYLKKNYFKNEDFDMLIVITSQYHLERVRYIFSKLFIKSTIEFIAVNDTESENKINQILARQDKLLTKTKKYLGDMKRGDLSFLDDSIYKSWYYEEDRPIWVQSFVAKGK